MPAQGNLSVEERLSVRVVRDADAHGSFADEVRSGLLATPKSLPPRFFYDALGSKLFEAICQLPEYYLPRAEHGILAEHAGEMLASVERPVRIVELGSGSAEKTEHFLSAALERQESLVFTPIDLSEAAITESSERLLRQFPDLRVEAIRSTYEAGLSSLAPAAGGARTVALFLGSSIGNLDGDESAALLRRVRDAIGPGGALVLGADLKKPTARIVAAYDDPAGVTAAFNLNVLGRINRELGGHFDLRAFRHVALYDDEKGRVEMHLESRFAQRVPIDGLKTAVAFAAGERVHTENSYKYDRADLDRIASASGFRVAKTWTDPDGLFSSSLLVTAEKGPSGTASERPPEAARTAGPRTSRRRRDA